MHQVIYSSVSNMFAPVRRSLRSWLRDLLRIDAPTKKPARVDVAAQRMDVTATNDENKGKNAEKWKNPVIDSETRLCVATLRIAGFCDSSQKFLG